MKKRARQQKTQFGRSWFCLGFTDTFWKMYENPQARATRRGPPGPTMIIYKKLIRFNNNNNNNNNNHYPTIPWDGISRQGTPLGEGLIPHFVGGIHKSESLLFSPYPAVPPYVVKTLHPGITDDRAITKQALNVEGEVMFWLFACMLIGAFY